MCSGAQYLLLTNVDLEYLLQTRFLGELDGSEDDLESSEGGLGTLEGRLEGQGSRGILTTGECGLSSNYVPFLISPPCTRTTTRSLTVQLCMLKPLALVCGNLLKFSMCG